MIRFFLLIGFLFLPLVEASTLPEEELRLILSLQKNPPLQAWWPWSPPKEEPETKGPPFSALELEQKISERVIGQPQAITNTVNALLCYYAGIHDPKKPLGSFLYIGPTGVGKTELAKELARQLFQDESKLIRLDMSEYLDEHLGLTRLIGSSPGYVNNEKGGVLSNAILENPHSIILLDEIEKAHPKIRMLFLHIFDEGFFKDGMGKDIDCHNCLFISTTNLASQTILSLDPFSYETALEYVEPQLIKALTPEFYNRVDPVIFQGLSFDVLRNIVKIKLDLLAQNVFKQKQVKVYFDEYLVDYIQTKGYHHLLGARPMQRLIKNELTALIARTLLREAYLPGDAMYLSYVEGSVIITRLTEEEAKEVLETNY